MSTSMAPDRRSPSEGLDDVTLVRMAFAPLHKSAFGAAIGIAAGLVVFLATAVDLIRNPDPAFPLEVLSVFFRGYTVSWTGAWIGALWAGFTGFIAGWFFAFCRNAVIATYYFILRIKAELSETRDILDHL